MKSLSVIAVPSTVTALTDSDFADGITVPPILAGDNEIAGDAHGGEPGLEPIRL